MTKNQNDTKKKEQEKIIMERTFMGERKNGIRERKPGKKGKNGIRKCAEKNKKKENSIIKKSIKDELVKIWL